MESRGKPPPAKKPPPPPVDLMSLPGNGHPTREEPPGEVLLPPPSVIVSNKADGSRIIRDILSPLPAVAVHCEGVDLGVSGRLSLIQITSSNQPIFLFDILNCPPLVELLKPLLESKTTLKVFHDSRRPCANLLTEFGIHLQNVLNTIQSVKFLTVGGKENDSNTKKDSIKDICSLLKINYSGTPKPKGSDKKKYWLFRPLPSDMISYGVGITWSLWRIYEGLGGTLDQVSLDELINKQSGGGGVILQNKNRTKGPPRGNWSKSKPKPNGETKGTARPVNDPLAEFPDAKIEIIIDLKRGVEVTDEIRQKAMISIDCEGLNLGAAGRLTLLQICTDDKTVYLFDILACPSLMDLLKPILESDTIAKAIHDSRGDRANLRAEFRVNMSYIFDTQVAYKTVFKNDGKKRIGFNALCKKLGIGENGLKENMKYYMIHQRNYWMVRPLTQEMIEYAALDVLCLWRVHQKLHERLQRLGSRSMANFYRACHQYGVENNGGFESALFKWNKGSLVNKEEHAMGILIKLKGTREKALGLRWITGEKNQMYLIISTARKSFIFDMSTLSTSPTVLGAIRMILDPANNTQFIVFGASKEEFEGFESVIGVNLEGCKCFWLEKAFYKLYPDAVPGMSPFHMGKSLDKRVPGSMNVYGEKNKPLDFENQKKWSEGRGQIETDMKLHFFLYDKLRGGSKRV